MISQFVRRKRSLWWLVALNIVCIALFFYLHKRVEDQELIFTGTYQDGGEHWGKGLANVYIATKNLLVLMLLFVATQVVFWIFYNSGVKETRRRLQISPMKD